MVPARNLRGKVRSNMEQGTTFWLNVLSNFREGELLLTAIKEKEPFLRYPKIVSPLAADSYRRYTTFEIDGIQQPPLLSENMEALFWDGVILDQATRKFLFLAAFSSPDEIKKRYPNQSLQMEAFIEKSFSAYNAKGRLPCWLRDYIGVAFPMAVVQSLNDPHNGCFTKGYRGELFFLFLADDYTATSVPSAVWQSFEQEMWRRMMGEGSTAPRGIFSSVFSVGKPIVEAKVPNARQENFADLSFLGIRRRDE